MPCRGSIASRSLSSLPDSWGNLAPGPFLALLPLPYAEAKFWGEVAGQTVTGLPDF